MTTVQAPTATDRATAEQLSRRFAEATCYCTGEWDEELRARHAAEAPMIRP